MTATRPSRSPRVRTLLLSLTQVETSRRRDFLEDKNVPGLAAYRSSKPAPTVSRLAMFVFLFIISFRILTLLLLADLLAFGGIASSSGGCAPASGWVAGCR